MTDMARLSRPACEEIYTPPPRVGSVIIFHLVLTVSGILSNVLLLAVFSGRSKLTTASFTYIRILAILQFLFFMIPYPLALLTKHYQRGDSWIGVSFLPLILAFFHFAIASILLCFAVRLQVLSNYVTRCRKWNALGWVAWRKIFWIIPFGVILNVSLYFEYNIDYAICNLGNRTIAIGHARLFPPLKDERIKLEFIRAAPTIIYWLATVVAFGFILNERCVLPKVGSPGAVKHIPLIANLRPLLLSLLIAHSLVPVYYCYHLLNGRVGDSEMKLSLAGLSYALPFFTMFTFSEAFRSHTFHILSKQFNKPVSRKDSTIRRVTQSITRNVAYSRLEMENSEFEERVVLTRSMRTMLKEDAIYRVKFAMPQTVAIIHEEEEQDDRNSRTDSVDIESAEYLNRVQLDNNPFVVTRKTYVSVRI